jgi:hypothetical protein
VHSTHGQLVPTENQLALVEAIKEEFVRLDKYDSFVMHQKATEQFSYQAIGKKFSDIYESILWKHGS